MEVFWYYKLIFLLVIHKDFGRHSRIHTLFHPDDLGKYLAIPAAAAADEASLSLGASLKSKDWDTSMWVEQWLSD